MLKTTCFAALIAAALIEPAAAFVAIPCAGDAVVRAPAGVTAADQAFRTVWRDASPNWYTAFEAKPPKRNIFDKSAESEPPLETVKGVAWAHGLYCLANVAPDGSEVLVRYYARVAAFHEGTGWSRPFENGMLQAFLVKRSGATGEVWRAEGVANERTILLPNAVKSQPPLDTIPPTDAKTGIPCRSGSAWSGTTCVAVTVPKTQKTR
jgi:hypothetical protein